MAELSFQEIEWRIEEALQDLFPSAQIVEDYSPDTPWIVGVYPDYVIIETYENDSWQYWKASYNVDSEPVLASRSEWVEVESRSEWVIQAKERMTKFNAAKIESGNAATGGKTDAAIKFDINAPCGQKAIKILDEGERRIGAYATIWGELDCENERMTKGALENYVGVDAIPLMFWMHGLHTEFGSALVGKWDGAAFKMDDLGLWVEGEVYQNTVGDRAWTNIKTAGSYGLSVGSLWYLVQRQKANDGMVDITDWPLLEISIMEGGKQCVPSAHRQVKTDLVPLYREMLGAMKLNCDDLERVIVEDGEKLDDEGENKTDEPIVVSRGKRYRLVDGIRLKEIKEDD